MAYLFEACVDSIASALGAVRGGAGRIELCEALVEGGLTPSLGKIEGVVGACRESGTPVHVLVRPRGGDFCYDGDEVALMLRDVAAAAPSAATYGRYAGLQGPHLRTKGVLLKYEKKKHDYLLAAPSLTAAGCRGEGRFACWGGPRRARGESPQSLGGTAPPPPHACPALAGQAQS